MNCEQSDAEPGQTITGNLPRETETASDELGIAELLGAGLAHHQAGRLPEAEVLYQRILSIACDHADALHLLGVIAYQVGRHLVAIDLIGRAIQQNAHNPLYHAGYGLALQGLKRLDEAVASYDRALALQPDNAETLNNRGLALHELTHFGEALESYDRALAIRPDYAEVLNNRGNTLQELERLDEAITAYDRALALKPDLAEANHNRKQALRDIEENTQYKATFRAIFDLWQLQRRSDVEVRNYLITKRFNSKNPLVKKGEKYFSQSDEDGITLEIVKRLGIRNGTALEFGMGNGLENNSLILLAMGWRVMWIGNEDIRINIPDNCNNLAFSKNWVTKENCSVLASNLFIRFEIQQVDFLSIDLDGNDIYIFEELLKYGLRPLIIVVEYNGKFPPPIRWKIKYDPTHNWDGSDYQGASLQSFIDIAEHYGYMLVCCNVTGTNAYFVRSDNRHRFDDVPQDVCDIFYPADYNLLIARGHYASPMTIERFLE
jgi:tetratricopeptide (TPR) repeat protein